MWKGHSADTLALAWSVARRTYSSMRSVQTRTLVTDDFCVAENPNLSEGLPSEHLISAASQNLCAGEGFVTLNPLPDIHHDIIDRLNPLPGPTHHDVIERLRCTLANRKWGLEVVNDLKKLQVRVNSYQVAAVLKGMQDASTALGFFHWMEEQNGYRHNAFTYSRLFDILAEAKDFQTVEKMMQDMLDARLEMIPHIFTASARAYVTSGMSDSAVSTFLSMGKYGCKPDAQAFNIMIDLLTRAGRQDQAHNMYKNMVQSGYFPNLYTCNLLIDGFWRAGMAADAAALFQKMKVSGEQPSISTYNSLVKVFARDCEGQSLALVIKEMEEKGSFPNLTTYNTLIGALVQAGNAGIAMQFFDHMVGSELFPNNFTYAQLIDGLGRNDRLDEAQNLFKQLKSIGGAPDAYVYNALLINLSKGGRWNNAWGLVLEMKASGLKPSKVAYSILMDGMKQAKKPDYVRRVLDAMEKDGFPPHILAYHDLIEMFFTQREVDKAFQVLQDMKHLYPPDLGTYNLMLKLCSTAKDMKRCKLVFKNMNKSGIKPSIISYSTLIQSLGKTGKVKEACALFKEMQKKGCQPDSVAYGTLLKAMVNVGQVDKAMPIFEEGKKKYPNDLFMYSIMIDGYGKARKFDKAMGLLKEMRRQCIQPDVVVFNSLIASLLKSGDPEEAFDLYRGMKKYGCEPNGKTKDIVNSFMRKSMGRGRR